ncbi:tensin-2-like [Dipodomys merriami]|uniref:tensin-2-like n=1 Tax=Dipodomys merriami TaxID=94247 RepID=UPI003855CB1B
MTYGERDRPSRHRQRKVDNRSLFTPERGLETIYTQNREQPRPPNLQATQQAASTPRPVSRSANLQTSDLRSSEGEGFPLSPLPPPPQASPLSTGHRPALPRRRLSAGLCTRGPEWPPEACPVLTGLPCPAPAGFPLLQSLLHSNSSPAVTAPLLRTPGLLRTPLSSGPRSPPDSPLLRTPVSSALPSPQESPSLLQTTLASGPRFFSYSP